MFQNKSVSVGLFSLVLLCFGCFGSSGIHEELTPPKKLALEKSIANIREKRELFSQSLNNTIQSEDAFQKAYDARKKAKEESEKLEVAKNEAYEIHVAHKKTLPKDSQFLETYDKNQKRLLFAQKAYYESAQIALDFRSKLSLTSQRIHESKKKLWTKLNELLEMLSQSLETATKLLNLKISKKIVKNCFEMSSNLKETSKQHQDDLDIVNNKISVFNSTILYQIKLAKLVEIYLERNIKNLDIFTKFGKIWARDYDAFLKALQAFKNEKFKSKDVEDKLKYARNKINKIDKISDEAGKALDGSVKDSKKYIKEYQQELMNLSKMVGKLRKEIKTGEQGEKTLKMGLLRDTKTMFRDAIELLGKEPRAEDVYQEALKAYEEIEKFYEFLNEKYDPILENF